MLPRLPTPSDFPPSFLTLNITAPATGPPLNVLLLLHGLGDTHQPFTTLGQQLNLPETACLSLCGPTPIPSLITGSETPSFHWADDIHFSTQQGDAAIDPDASFLTSRTLISHLINEILIAKCAFPPRNIHLLGFGQGGMAALAAVTYLSDLEFGGVVSIGGRLPSDALNPKPSREGEENSKGKEKSGGSGIGKEKGNGPGNGKRKNPTPVLLCGGSKSTQVTRGAVDTLKERFAEVEYVRWQKADDGMPRSREEMLPVMRFLARRLRSRRGVPEGAVEV